MSSEVYNNNLIDKERNQQSKTKDTKPKTTIHVYTNVNDVEGLPNLEIVLCTGKFKDHY